MATNLSWKIGAMGDTAYYGSFSGDTDYRRMLGTDAYLTTLTNTSSWLASCGYTFPSSPNMNPPLYDETLRQTMIGTPTPGRDINFATFRGMEARDIVIQGKINGWSNKDTLLRTIRWPGVLVLFMENDGTNTRFVKCHYVDHKFTKSAKQGSDILRPYVLHLVAPDPHIYSNEELTYTYTSLSSADVVIDDSNEDASAAVQNDGNAWSLPIWKIKNVDTGTTASTSVKICDQFGTNAPDVDDDTTYNYMIEWTGSLAKNASLYIYPYTIGDYFLYNAFVARNGSETAANNQVKVTVGSGGNSIKRMPGVEPGADDTRDFKFNVKAADCDDIEVRMRTRHTWI